MFNDRYGLTEAVLSGRKTQTRRLASKFIPDAMQIGFDRLEVFGGKELRLYNGDKDFIKFKLPYQSGEIVAVAQSYKNAGFNPDIRQISTSISNFILEVPISCYPGWRNKMFILPALMPHRIRITNVRVERLNDISEDDCLAEGVGVSATDNRIGYPISIPFNYFVGEDKKSCRYSTPREAYAALIDRISKKGTWESNPFVFAYDFELVR